MESNVLFKTSYAKTQKSNRWPITLVLLGLALVTRVILLFAARYPSIVENLYSSTIYPYIAKGLGFISSIIPLSIAEILLMQIVLFIIIAIIMIILKPKYILNNSKKIFHHVLRLMTAIYVLFYLLWGFNYFREDYLVIANMNESQATYNELKELTSIMIEKANEIREFLPEDDNGLLLIQESFNELGEIANYGFDNYHVGSLDLGGNYGQVKPVFLSKYMSYTGIAGIYIPFTSEPTINTDIPNHSLLTTISHEIAHQRGFAKEDEANFISYKANINNPDEKFQYSGYYLAMNNLMNEVYSENPDDYILFYTKLSDGVKRDLESAREYWKSKEGKIRESVNNMNDNYLKANNQVDGVRSYNGIVNLLLAEYKDQKPN
ncbi:MAG: DUF3810 domain-containing protein [Tissierellaceae bacterium]|nr:DUF3810 domain-containing protein [Tissierellaceae bacterium]